MGSLLKKLRSWQGALVLLAVGMPGVTRLLFTLLVEKRDGLEAIGNFSADVAVVQLLGYFSSIGWCALLMVRVASAAESEQRPVIANHVLAAIPYMLGSVLICMALVPLGVIHSLIGAAILVFGWNLNQFMRRYYLAIKRYTGLFIFDSATVLLMMAVVFATKINPLVAFGLGFLLISGILYLKFAPYSTTENLKDWNSTHVKAAQFSAANLLSGGVITIVVPLVKFFDSVEVAGYVGLISGLLNFVMLSSRALGTWYLPDLAKAAKQDHAAIPLILKKFKRIMLLGIIGMSLVALLGWLALGLHFFPETATIAHRNVIFLLIVLTSGGSQLALPDSNVLMAFEDGSKLLKINLLASVVFLLGVALALLLAWGAVTVWVLTALLVSIQTRNLVIARETKRRLASHA